NSGNTSGNQNNSGNNSGNTNSGNTNSGNKNTGNKSNTDVNGKQVIPVLVQPGMPTVDVPVANVVTFRIPDAAKIVSDAVEQGSSNVQGSSR
ncbi:MAG: hypothetical protein ACTH0A_10520, partial [Corynebacterium casei]